MPGASLAASLPADFQQMDYQTPAGYQPPADHPAPAVHTPPQQRGPVDDGYDHQGRPADQHWPGTEPAPGWESEGYPAEGYPAESHSAPVVPQPRTSPESAPAVSARVAVPPTDKAAGADPAAAAGSVTASASVPMPNRAMPPTDMASVPAQPPQPRVYGRPTRPEPEPEEILLPGDPGGQHPGSDHGAPAGYGYDQPSSQGGYEQIPTGGGYDQGPSHTGYDQSAPRGGYEQNPSRGSGYDQEPAPSGYEQEPAPSGYEQNPPYGGYEQEPPRGGYEQSAAPNGYDQNPPHGGYDQEPPYGGYEENPAPGGYDQQPVSASARVTPPAAPIPDFSQGHAPFGEQVGGNRPVNGVKPNTPGAMGTARTGGPERFGEPTAAFGGGLPAGFPEHSGRSPQDGPDATAFAPVVPSAAPRPAEAPNDPWGQPTAAWSPAGEPEQGRFDGFKPEAESKTETAPPPKVRNGRVLLAVLTAAVLLLVVPLGALWLLGKIGNDGDGTAFDPAVNSCVKQSGNSAVAATCGEPGTFTIVSKVDARDKCTDKTQPHVVLPGSGTNRVLCLKPAAG